MNLKKTQYGREGRIFCKLCDSEIKLYIPDDEVTEEYAQKCVEALNNMSEETIDVICRAAKAYCLKFMEIAESDFEEEMTVQITSETPAKELLKCFTPTTLIVEEPENDSKIGYQLECNCDWEIEHGMEIDILEERVVYLGTFDGYSPWLEYDESEWNFVNSI